ncbi:MAG: glycosyltransferase [Bryobacteraceae bacterium]
MGAYVEGGMVNGTVNSKENPLLTVLMPVYNTEPGMLRSAIESILDQSHRAFEFLILDDGSENQGTRSFLEQFARKDHRIRICWEPHRGLTQTLNRGLELARGTWIARQDADDWSAYRRLERQVEFFTRHSEAVLCGTQAAMHRADGRSLWPTRLPAFAADISAAFPRGNPFVHGSTMFRTAAARAIGGYREEFPCAQDYDFFWRLSELGEVRNIDAVLYHYRFTPNAVSARRAADQARAHCAAGILASARKTGGEMSIAEALERARLQQSDPASILRAALKQADHRMLAGDYWGAASAFASLAFRHPASLLAWGKLARFAVYALLPPARQACFREAYSR